MKRSWRAPLICLAIGLGCLRVYAADPSLEEILAAMQKKEAEVSAVKFDFEQTITYMLTGEKQSARGQLTFMKPGNLRLTTKNPMDQVIVSDGKKVWIYTPAYKQVIVDSWKKWLSSSMVPDTLFNLGKNWDDLKKRYTFTLVASSVTAHEIIMQPKKKSSWLLRLWVDRELLVPVRARLEEKSVMVDTVTSGYTVNPDVNREMFSFKKPPDVEELKLP